ncbi:unnamed protein product [Scytosiphon promiscuus]
MSKKAKKTLSDRLAELTSAAPIASFNPDAPEFDDGTGAGLARYNGDEDYDEGLDGPSAGLRVAADMESIGQEYNGKRVSRKSLEATVGKYRRIQRFLQPHQPKCRNSNPTALTCFVKKKSTTPKENMCLLHVQVGRSFAQSEPRQRPFVSPLSELHSERGIAIDQAKHQAGAGKRVHWGEDGDDEDEQDRQDGAGSKRRKQAQANVFAGVSKEGADTDASMEEQMRQLDKQDEKARKAGGGVAGQGELRRAREALRQREWWDGLLEVRILLQRLMNAANKLPGPNELPLFLEGDEELAALAEESAGTAEGLTTQLSAVRRLQMSCWGIAGNNPGEEHGSDHNGNMGTIGESESDVATVAMVTDDDGEEAKEASGDSSGEVAAARDHRSCMGWWEGVLGRWHERTQLVDPSLQKKFRVVNQGPWAQITASLADRERAQRRAFMTEAETAEFLGRKIAKKLEATRVGADAGATSAEERGGDDEEGSEEVLGRERRKEGSEPLDLEVIDDRDLYQHLLKEFMDASGAAGGGYAAVPVRRKSRKKSVDRKASKGRKIKYVTHPKMQNFMFPQEYESPPMEPSELFASLFGGAGTTQ